MIVRLTRFKKEKTWILEVCNLIDLILRLMFELRPSQSYMFAGLASQIVPWHGRAAWFSRSVWPKEKRHSPCRWVGNCFNWRTVFPPPKKKEIKLYMHWVGKHWYWKSWIFMDGFHFMLIFPSKTVMAVFHGLVKPPWFHLGQSGPSRNVWFAIAKGLKMLKVT